MNLHVSHSRQNLSHELWKQEIVNTLIWLSLALLKWKFARLPVPKLFQKSLVSKNPGSLSIKS